MTLDEARKHVGHDVLYTQPHGPTEIGRITEVRPTRGAAEGYVFVRYLGDVEAKATDPYHLRLIRRIDVGSGDPPMWRFTE